MNFSTTMERTNHSCQSPTQMDEVYKHLSDGEIWDEFRKGNEQAFAYLYKHYIVMLYHYGNRQTPDRNLVEDCIQDLFIDLWRNRRTLGDTTSIKFYLYKALKRTLVKKLISQRNHPTDADIPEEYDFEMVLSPELELVAQQLSQEQKDRLLKALNALTAHQKQAIVLKFYDGLSYQDIASLLSMSIRSTYNLIYRAIGILRMHLEKIMAMLIFFYFT
jgi:RNA polymerase sigma factor (sigma-70 family)